MVEIPEHKIQRVIERLWMSAMEPGRVSQGYGHCHERTWEERRGIRKIEEKRVPCGQKERDIRENEIRIKVKAGE